MGMTVTRKKKTSHPVQFFSFVSHELSSHVEKYGPSTGSFLFLMLLFLIFLLCLSHCFCLLLVSPFSTLLPAVHSELANTLSALSHY